MQVFWLVTKVITELSLSLYSNW